MDTREWFMFALPIIGIGLRRDAASIDTLLSQAHAISRLARRDDHAGPQILYCPWPNNRTLTVITEMVRAMNIPDVCIFLD